VVYVLVLFFTLTGNTMDWDLAIKRNTEALKGIIAALFVLLGLDGTDRMVLRLPHSLHRAVLRVLHPAESAVRRLIVIVARGLVVKLVPSRPLPAGPIIGKGGRSRPSFKLFDSRKNFAELRQHHRRVTRNPPRIHFFGPDPRVAALWPAPRPVATPAPPPDGLVNGARLTRRLQALSSALADLPRQARRLARWRLKRKNMPAPKFTSPLRPGRPPGSRRKKIHEVDEVLAECHYFAWEALKPDTS
jgi:hypothetical protein